MITLEIARALVARGLAIVPTESDTENGPALFLHRLKNLNMDLMNIGEKLCFAGAGASCLQRYVQTIARISEDKNGAWWFNAVCREFDDPFMPVMLRRS